MLRAASRQSAVDVEILSRLYDSEERIARRRRRVALLGRRHSLDDLRLSQGARRCRARRVEPHAARAATERAPRWRPRAALCSRSCPAASAGCHRRSRRWHHEGCHARAGSQPGPASRSIAGRSASTSQGRQGRRPQRQYGRARRRAAVQRRSRRQLGSAQRPVVHGETTRPRRDPPFPSPPLSLPRHQRLRQRRRRQSSRPPSPRAASHHRLLRRRRHRLRVRRGCRRCSSACAHQQRSGPRLARHATSFAGFAKE